MVGDHGRAAAPVHDDPGAVAQSMPVGVEHVEVSDGFSVETEDSRRGGQTDDHELAAKQVSVSRGDLAL